MSHAATAERFEGGAGAWYSNYRRLPDVGRRAQRFADRFPPGTVGKILVAGCGWGFLVEELLDRGYDAWGCDVSAYCVTKAAAVLTPAAAARVLSGDCTARTSLAAVKTAAGLPNNNQRFDLGITEDLLPCCLSDAEANTVLTELRRVCLRLYHVITCRHPDPAVEATVQRGGGMLWKTAAEWKVLTGSTETVYSTEERAET